MVIGLAIGICFFWGNEEQKQTERTEEPVSVIEMPVFTQSAAMESSEELSQTNSSELKCSGESLAEVESTEMEAVATQPPATEPPVTDAPATESRESESAEEAPTQMGDDWSGGDF